MTKLVKEDWWDDVKADEPKKETRFGHFGRPRPAVEQKRKPRFLPEYCAFYVWSGKSYIDVNGSGTYALIQPKNEVFRRFEEFEIINEDFDKNFSEMPTVEDPLKFPLVCIWSTDLNVKKAKEFLKSIEMEEIPEEQIALVKQMGLQIGCALPGSLKPKKDDVVGSSEHQLSPNEPSVTP
jgi:hypothetical protein